MTHRILVIEDNVELAQLLALHLRDCGHQVDLCHHGREGLTRAIATPYDLVVLDLMLPGIDGLTVCRRLREQPRHVPVLMLTSKSSEVDRVVGLEMGADDYVTKPFSIKELLARVKALFRRIDALLAPANAAVSCQLHVDDLTIDLEKHKVTLGCRQIELTAKEFDLLVHFARTPGRVHTRTQLLDQVWGYGHDGYEHTVNSHINRLRAKIEANPTEPHYIRTVWGVGYKFTEVM